MKLTICDPLYKNLAYDGNVFLPILTRVNRARHKLSFDIYDIILWLTMYGIRSSQTRRVSHDTFQKQPVEVNFALLPQFCVTNRIHVNRHKIIT